MFEDIRKYMELNVMDCSYLVKPVENNIDITLVPRSDEKDREREYYKEPSICLLEYEYEYEYK